MPLDVGDIVEVKFHGSIFGQRTITTFPYAVTTASSNPSVPALLQLIANYADNGSGSPGLEFYGCCPQNWTCEFITAQKVFPLLWRSQKAIVGLPGLLPNDATTANTAASIERASEFGGRPEVGRISIPAVAPQYQDDGLLTPTMTTAMAALALVMKTPWSNTALIDPTLVLTPCIVHRRKVGVPPDQHWEIQDYSIVAYTDVKLEVRTQRTRNIGKGV